MNLDLSPELAASDLPGEVAPYGVTPSVVAHPFPSVRLLIAGLRRRWRLWAATTVAGIVVALVFSMAVPPDHSATTVILLRHSSSTEAARALETAAELLKTRTVAQRVIRRLHLNLSERALISTYQVTTPSNEILKVRVTGPTPGDAVRRADAVAEEFLAFRREELQRQARAVVQALEERQGELTSEIAALNEGISTFPTDGGDAAVRQLGDLLTRRAVLEGQVGQLRARIDEALVDPTSMVEQSRVIDRASNDERAPLKALAVNLAAGAVAGLAVGAGGVVLHDVITSDRLRRRQDVAAVLGAPVAVSVGGLRGRPAAQCRRFKRHLGKPRPDLVRVVRHLRRSVSSRGTISPTLVVVSVESDGPAALAVASTAVDLVSEGRSVLVVDLSKTSALASVFSVPKDKTSTLHFGETAHAVAVAVPAVPLVDGDDGPTANSELASLRRDADVVLVLATSDPAAGAWHLVRWGTTAVAVVTAGRSTAAALGSTAQLARAAGLKVDSAVLVGTDPDDDTAGLADLPASTFPVDAAHREPAP